MYESGVDCYEKAVKGMQINSALEFQGAGYGKLAQGCWMLPHLSPQAAFLAIPKTMNKDSSLIVKQTSQEALII